MDAANIPNRANLIEAIKLALHNRHSKHLEIWRAVVRRYPDTQYKHFDLLMGQLEMADVIQLTGSRGPNTYRLVTP